MKKIIIICSILITVFISGYQVKADDGDLYNLSTNTKEYSVSEYSTNAQLLSTVILDMLLQGNTYALEYNGKAYKCNDIFSRVTSMDVIDSNTMKNVVSDPTVTSIDVSNINGFDVEEIN